MSVLSSTGPGSRSGTIAPRGTGETSEAQLEELEVARQSFVFAFRCVDLAVQ